MTINGLRLHSVTVLLPEVRSKRTTWQRKGPKIGRQPPENPLKGQNSVAPTAPSITWLHFTGPPRQACSPPAVPLHWWSAPPLFPHVSPRHRPEPMERESPKSPSPALFLVPPSFFITSRLPFLLPRRSTPFVETKCGVLTKNKGYKYLFLLIITAADKHSSLLTSRKPRYLRLGNGNQEAVFGAIEAVSGTAPHQPMYGNYYFNLYLGNFLII